MKLAILSRAPRAYSTQRLRAAAIDRGHDVRVLNTLRFAIDLSSDEPDLQYRGKQLSDYDAILPRIGNSITYFGTAVVRQFEQMDVYTPNTASGIPLTVKYSFQAGAVVFLLRVEAQADRRLQHAVHHPAAQGGDGDAEQRAA